MTAGLERFYDDATWRSFASTLLSEASAAPPSVVEALGGDVELATVLAFVVGPDSPNYVHRSVPALDGLSPAGCVARGLTPRLRAMLMRMH